MSRLPLGDLETALKDPKDYRKKIDASHAPGFGPSYFGFLRIALLRYHQSRDIGGSRKYLEERLDRFKSAQRRAETLDQFDWYINDYIGRGWPTFETRFRIQVRLPSWAPDDLRCSGEVPRVDVVPQGGYAAWLMKSREPEGWKQHLEMPLIQSTVAHMLDVPIDEVQVGLCSFQERFVDLHTFSIREIQQSHSTLESLLREMGY